MCRHLIKTGLGRFASRVFLTGMLLISGGANAATHVPVVDKSHVADSSGTASGLVISAHEHSFFRFDITDETSVDSAVLRIHYQSSGDVTVTAYGYTSDIWQEFDSSPPDQFGWDAANSVGSGSGSGTGYIDIDVSSYVISELNLDGFASFEVGNDQGSWKIFSSRESANPPQLIIVSSSGSNTTGGDTPAGDGGNSGSDTPDSSGSGTTQTLLPVADKSNAIDPNGVATSLIMSTHEHGFFRFDVSAQSTVSSAILRLHYDGSALIEMSAYPYANDTWTEVGDPPQRLGADISSRIAATSFTGPGYLELDVSTYVAAQAAGDGVVSFELGNDQGSWHSFGSRESANPPQLIVVSSGGSTSGGDTPSGDGGTSGGDTPSGDGGTSGGDTPSAGGGSPGGGGSSGSSTQTLIPTADTSPYQ